MAFTSQPSRAMPALDAFLDKIVVERLPVLFDDAHCPPRDAGAILATPHPTRCNASRSPSSCLQRSRCSPGGRRDAYPEFLPWCGGCDVLDETRGKVGAPHINYHGVKAHFTTDNVNTPPESIVVTLNDGPFRHLHGEWTFRRWPRTRARSSWRSRTSSRPISSPNAGRARVQPHRAHVHRRVRQARGRGVRQRRDGGVTVRVTVATRRRAEAIVPVVVHDGATVADAVAASGLVARCALDPGAIAFAIHGQRGNRGAAMRDGDRIEITVRWWPIRRRCATHGRRIIRCRNRASAAPQSSCSGCYAGRGSVTSGTCTDFAGRAKSATMPECPRR